MFCLDDRNINLEMVKEGYAEAFIEYLKPPYRTQFLDPSSLYQATRQSSSPSAEAR